VGGLPALVRARPGPRRAHKLTPEVVAFLAAALEEEPELRAPELARRVEEAFGVAVHPRSVERALERSRRPKSR
jgi:transposase